jgi:hypothetical protein
MRQAVNTVVDRHPVVVYTVARVALFAAVLAPLYLLGLRGFLLLVIAVVLSGVLSLVLLNRVRAGFSSVVSGYFSRVNQRIDAATRAEDDEDPDVSTDQRQSQPQSQPGQQ